MVTCSTSAWFTVRLALVNRGVVADVALGGAGGRVDGAGEEVRDLSDQDDVRQDLACQREVAIPHTGQRRMHEAVELAEDALFVPMAAGP